MIFTVFRSQLAFVSCKGLESPSDSDVSATNCLHYLPTVYFSSSYFGPSGASDPRPHIPVELIIYPLKWRFYFLNKSFFRPKENNPDQIHMVRLNAAMYPSIYDANQAPGKPLLSASDSDTLDSDMDQDIEAQRSYRTFHTPRADSDSVSSGSSTPRSRINPRIISDAILGLSDGLTVPFALSAGLSALGNTKVVVLGGLAELAAGAISMGLGGYVGAKSEAYVLPLTSLLYEG